MIKISNLPGAYQQVEYLESSGPQFIDTGIYASGDLKVDITFSMQTYRSNTWQCLLGARDYDNNSWNYPKMFCIYANYSTSTGNNMKISHNYYSSDLATNYDYKTGEIYNIVLDKGSVYIDNTLVSQISTTQADFDTSVNDVNLYLFNNHFYSPDTHNVEIQNRDQRFRIYSCKIWNGSNVLIKDFIPCYRKSDNTPGMYDLVSESFITNGGTGTFLKGEDVPDVKSIKIKVNNVMKDIQYIKIKHNAAMATVYDVLPSAYKKYDYIWIPTNTGSSSEPRVSRYRGAFLALKQYADLNKIGFEFEFQCQQVYPSNFYVNVVGGRSASGSTNSLALYLKGDGFGSMHYHGNDTTFTSVSYVNDVKYKCKYTNPSTSPAQITIGNNSQTLSWTSASTIPNTNLYLFSNPTPSDLNSLGSTTVFTVRVKVGTIKVFDTDENLINKYIPCVRKSDKVIGFYDVIEGIFYTTISSSYISYATLDNPNCFYAVGYWNNLIGITVNSNSPSTGSSTGYSLKSDETANAYTLMLVKDFSSDVYNYQSFCYNYDNRLCYKFDASTTVKVYQFNSGYTDMILYDTITLPSSAGHNNDACYLNGNIYFPNLNISDLYVWNITNNTVSTLPITGITQLTTGSTRQIDAICDMGNKDGWFYLIGRDVYTSDITHQSSDKLSIYKYNISTHVATLLAEFPWNCVYVQGATYYKGILYITCNSPTTSSASNYTGITIKAIRTDIWELIDELKVSGSFEPEGLDVVALGNTSSLTYEIMMGMGKSGVMSQAVRFSIPYEL